MLCNGSHKDFNSKNKLGVLKLALEYVRLSSSSYTYHPNIMFIDKYNLYKGTERPRLE